MTVAQAVNLTREALQERRSGRSHGDDAQLDTIEKLARGIASHKRLARDVGFADADLQAFLDALNHQADLLTRHREHIAGF